MKKSKILAIICALMLVVTGCGGKESKPEDVASKAIEKMKGLDNYHVSMTMDMTFTEGGVSASVIMNVDEDYDAKNHTAYTFTSTSMLGQDIEMESYTEMKDGKSTNYTSSGEDTWIKSVVEEETTAPVTDLDVISRAKENKVVKEENETKTYEATLDKEITKELIEGMDIEIDENTELQDTVMKYVVNKDGYVTRYDMAIPVSQQGQTSTITIVVHYSQFNTVGDIIIPQEIIDSAQEF